MGRPNLKTDGALRDRNDAYAQDQNGVERVLQLLAHRAPLALFLDVDGTLVEMALTPSTVRIPPRLAEILTTISTRLSGAVAIVTGRPLADADQLLQPLRFAGAGVHGAEMRVEPSGNIRSLAPSFAPDLAADVHRVAKALPGVVIEDKGNGISLHYRLAPEHHAPLLSKLEALLPRYPGQFMICGGRKVVEVLPVGFSKGRALRQLAALPNFANRTPVMIGDDVADVDAFGAAEELGGYGLKVAGEHFSHDEADFSGPAAVLDWLQAVSEQA